MKTRFKIVVLFQFLLSLCFFNEISRAQSNNPIIPKPVSFQNLSQKSISVNSQTAIIGPKQYEAQLQYLRGLLAAQTGLNLAVNPSKFSGSSIVIKQDSQLIDKAEMYLLESKNNEIKITIKDLRGLVNAIQTLAKNQQL